MDYQKFKKDYEDSGLTQRAYGEQISMSSSMVSYYLRRAREQEDHEPSGIGQFQEVEITGSRSLSRHVKILTPDGLEITIPL
jgi:predicted transcriptional regulator